MEEPDEGSQGAAAQKKAINDDASAYVKAVRDTFKDNDTDKYDEFLDIMHSYKTKRISSAGAIRRVQGLFNGYPSLISGFNTFLPKGYVITLRKEEPAPKKQPAKFRQSQFMKKVRTRFQNDVEQYQAFLKLVKKYREGDERTIREVSLMVDGLFAEHSDLLEELTCFLPHETAISNEKELAFFDKVKGRLCDRNSYQAFLKCLNLFSQDVISRAELQRLASDILGKHADLMEGLDEFLSLCETHDGYLADAVSGSRKFEARKVKLGKEKDRARSRSRSRDSDRERDREQGTGERDSRDEDSDGDIEQRELAREQRKRQDDLREKEEEREQDVERGRKGDTEEDKDRAREWVQERDVERERREMEKEKGGEREQKEKEQGWSCEWRKLQEREKLPTHKLKEVPSHKVCLTSGKAKYANTLVSEVDLSNCKQCTPSYRLLPRDYCKPRSSQRTKLAEAVLNDNLVLVTSGSEDRPFKNVLKNQYEESLFLCEEDRFELDMLLETTIATAKRVEEISQRIQAPSLKQETTFDIKELSAINLRCIERIYGDHGLEIIDLLKKNPVVALPVVLLRLKQKQEEWQKFRTEMNKVWANVYLKNYHKSVDHRSLYFKQQDKKSLRIEAMLAEIKEISEKRRKVDDSIQAIPAANCRPVPDLIYKFVDQGVHEDMYEIVKLSCEELCPTLEHAIKSIQIYIGFLETFYGVPPRLRDAEAKALEIPEICKKSIRVSGGESAASDDTDHADDTTSALHNEGTIRKMDLATSSSHTGDAVLPVAAAESESVGLVSSATAQDVLETIEKRSESMVHGALCGDNLLFGQISSSSCQILNHSGAHGGSPQASAVQLTLARPCRAILEVSRANEPRPSADEPEESAQKSSEDSENASVADDGILGVERGGGGAASRDEVDEEEEGHEGMAEREVEADGVADADDGEGEDNGNTSLAPPYVSGRRCKPLAARAASTDCLVGIPLKDCDIFYGNDSFFYLYRLHQTLYERILAAKTHALAAERKCTLTEDTAAPNFYARFIRVLQSLLDGSADSEKYEDECRTIIGTQSYMLFTLDKLIYKFVKQLQTIATDDVANKLLTLYCNEKSRTTAVTNDTIYFANACQLLVHGENIFRFERISNAAELHIHLMEDRSEKIEVPPNTFESSFAGNHSKLVDEDEDAAISKAMENVLVMNGLVWRNHRGTSKAYYVFGTEDFFHRQKKQKLDSHLLEQTSVSTDPARVARFHRWLDDQNK